MKVGLFKVEKTLCAACSLAQRYKWRISLRAKEEVIMKKILVVTGMIIGLTAVTALAQMSGGGTGGQQPPQSGDMMVSQMMSQEMMRDMSGMMRQMNEMMQKLSHTMEHKTVTDHAMMQDMGKM